MNHVSRTRDHRTLAPRDHDRDPPAGPARGRTACAGMLLLPVTAVTAVLDSAAGLTQSNRKRRRRGLSGPT